MRLYAIYISRWPIRDGEQPVIIASGFELSSFGFFQRSSVKEWGNFFTKTLIKNTTPGVRQSVQQDEYGCHVQVRHDGISGAVVTDREYPPRVAFTFLQSLLEEFLKQFRGDWTTFVEPVPFPKLDEYLIKYQNPAADGENKIEQVMKLVDETKIIMHQNIETALQNQQSLDSLVDKSEDLKWKSKVFYKQAKQANRCCTILWHKQTHIGLNLRSFGLNGFGS